MFGVGTSGERIASLLVLGGARSGKSSFAQARAEESGLAPVFVATAEARDHEMAERIARHVEARGSRWRLIEAPYALGEAMAAAAGPDTILLVDCLTLWLTNVMLRGDDVAAASDMLVDSIAGLAGPVILVSNEVGSGIVPETPLGRRFRDAQGRLNQAMARACDGAVLVVAGLPMLLKPTPPLRFPF